MRRMTLAIVGIGLLTGLAALSAAGQADVGGSWRLVIQTPRGEMTSTATFIQDGGRLKVSMTGPRGRETTGEGSIKGRDIQWTVVRDTAQGRRTIVYTGTVQDGEMSGQAEIDGGNTVSWKAVKS